jgi:hypothetical protein
MNPSPLLRLLDIVDTDEVDDIIDSILLSRLLISHADDTVDFNDQSTDKSGVVVETEVGVDIKERDVANDEVSDAVPPMADMIALSTSKLSYTCEVEIIELLNELKHINVGVEILDSTIELLISAISSNSNDDIVVVDDMVVINI